MVELSNLLSDLSNVDLQAVPQGTVSAVRHDSRAVQAGDLFVAIKGTRVDGHDFLHQAAERGAIAALVEQVDPEVGLPQVRVPDSRLALAEIAAAWHDHPGRSLTMIAVTGTDGKTTTTNLIYSILRAAEIPVGMISTVEARIGGQVLDTGFHVTTPEAFDVQSYLAQMVRAGLTHCVLEATSHGLAQRRVAGCEFDIAVVTNITHEHLDFHGSWEEYFQAKAYLLELLDRSQRKPGGPDKLAVLNIDDQAYARLQGLTDSRQITYGRSPSANIRLRGLEERADGIRFRLEGARYSSVVNSKLLGGYNAWNIAAAFAAAVEGLGVAPDVAIVGVEGLQSVPGRMERINLGQDFGAIVDFAHTPNALRQSLKAARELTSGRVIAVFGSAGLRDREKRRLMAEVSAELADISVLTAEDPRTEALEDILAEMAAAAQGRGAEEGADLFLEPDRGDALRLAVKLARGGDLVIACGKGHEQSMCFLETEYPWDDRTALRAALAEYLGVPGPEMPILPTSSGAPQGTSRA